MENIKVLIVDDEEDFVETVVKRLVDRGVQAVGGDQRHGSPGSM